MPAKPYDGAHPMRTMREILNRQEEIRAEMRSLHEAAGPDGNLSSEQQHRWSELEGEASGLQTRQARQATLDDAERRMQGQPLAGTGDRNLDREMRSFSLVRAIASQVPNLNVDAGRERELSQEIARRAGRPFAGMAVPMAIFQQPAEQRIMTTALPVSGPGSNLIATDYRGDQYIDMLREALAIRRLGARVLSGLVGNVAIPRQTQATTAAWVNEDSPIPMSDMAWDQVNLTPKHVGARTEFSRNMLLQTSPDIETLVRQDFAAVLAREVDRAAVNGTGVAPYPRGILNTTGIGNVALGTDGGTLTYDAIIDLIGQVEDAYVAGSSAGFLGNRKIKRAVLKMKNTTGDPYGTGVVFQGINQVYSDVVPGNLTKGASSGSLSALIYGNWSDLLVGYWSEFDLLVNPYEGVAYSKGNVQVRGMITMDVTVRHPTSFAAIHDVATA
jgi:HK97 family phage major capsid protein